MGWLKQYCKVQEQDNSSDIEQQPPFDTKTQNKEGVTKPTGTSYNFDKSSDVEKQPPFVDRR